VFNVQGSELIIILLLALVVLGPEKLPEAMRKAGRMYADLKKMASGFQEEFRSAIDEPMREMKGTVDLIRDSADFTKLASGERDVKPVSAQMPDPSKLLAPADPDLVPVDEIPFSPASTDTGPTGIDEFESLPAVQDDDPQPDADGSA